MSALFLHQHTAIQLKAVTDILFIAPENEVFLVAVGSSGLVKYVKTRIGFSSTGFIYLSYSK
jgi:hypothetical protein